MGSGPNPSNIPWKDLRREHMGQYRLSKFFAHFSLANLYTFLLSIRLNQKKTRPEAEQFGFCIKKYPDHKTRVFYLLSSCIPESLTASCSSSLWKTIKGVSNKTPWLGNHLWIWSSRSKSPSLWKAYTFIFPGKCPGALPYVRGKWPTRYLDNFSMPWQEISRDWAQDTLKAFSMC